MFKRLCLSVAATCLVAAAPAVASAAVFGTNLIVNGDAEAGPSTPNGDPVASIPGWGAGLGGPTVVSYAPIEGAFPSVADPGPANRGNQLFAGGAGDVTSVLTQSIDLSAGAAQIDLGTATYDLSGYLGGYAGQDDFTTLEVSFISAANAAIGGVDINGPGAADRGDTTGLLLVDTSDFVPIGARTALVSIIMHRQEGDYNDGYADNLSLVLTPGDRQPNGGVPEPATWALMLTGFGTLGAALRGRRSLQAAA